jgi:hypothetical protein
VAQAIEQLSRFDPRTAGRSDPSPSNGRYVLLDVFTDRPLEGN